MTRGFAAAITCVCLSSVAVSPGAAPQAQVGTVILKRIITDVPKVTSVAVSDAGRLYVLAPDDHSVSVHDLSGRAIGRIGVIGNAPGELLNPTDLAVAPDGAVWVVDKGNHRLQRFNHDGRVVAEIRVPSPLSLTVGAGGEVWVVTAFDRTLLRAYNSGGAQIREVGDPVRVSDMPAEQEAYLSRGRVIAIDGGLLYMFRALPNPKLLRLDAKGQIVREIPVESPALDGARARARQMEQDLRKTGGFRYSSTLNGVAVEPARGIIWVCPAAPILLAYDLKSGSKLAQYELKLEDPSGEKAGLQDIAVRGKTAYGVVAKHGVVRFDLPALPKGN